MRGWQNPNVEVDIPNIKLENQEIMCWALWTCYGTEPALEIRIVRKTFAVDSTADSDDTVYIGYVLDALLPTGGWVHVPEMEEVPIAQLLTLEEAKRLGIQELDKDRHVNDISKDACLRCGYTGQQAHHDREAGFEMPCLGWLDQKIGMTYE